jgi:hypothetical protein
MKHRAPQFDLPGQAHAFNLAGQVQLTSTPQTQTPKKNMLDRTTELFGSPVFTYTRAEALADGVLVDMTQAVTPCPFKWPVAMTRPAYEATIAAGGKWVPLVKPTPEASEHLVLPNGQDIPGRAWDVFNMILRGIRPGESRVDFIVLVDIHGLGCPVPVHMYSLAGPGDNGEPVITIMLQGED